MAGLIMNGTSHLALSMLKHPQMAVVIPDSTLSSSSSKELSQKDKNCMQGNKNQSKRQINETQSSEEELVFSVPKRIKKPNFVVRNKEISAFFRLLECEDIYDFIHADTCRLLTDKYLLSMVFTYFKRAAFSIRHYSKMNFFIALYLANDMEEDEEEFKYEIFPWALGRGWKSKYMKFLRNKDRLWSRIGYRAVVSKKCCEEIIAIEPNHWAWQRERPDHHGGAIRAYIREREEDDTYPRGPDGSPRKCKKCIPYVEYDSASPDNTVWYLSSSTDSSPETCHGPSKCVRINAPDALFNMKGLQHTLNEDEGIWACVNES